MQLNKKKSIRLALAAASCTLLAEHANATEANGWIINFGTLFYREDNRVNIMEPMVTAKHKYNEEDSFTLRYIRDTMSGASPTGASISTKQQLIPVQSNTSSSGSTNKYNPVDPYTLPLSKFLDERIAVGINWNKSLSRTFHSILGANYSTEHDYRSTSGNITLLKDTADKLTTFTLGVSYSNDSVIPIGGVPIPLRLLQPPSIDNGEATQGTRKNKQVLNGLVGVTQVISRRVLMQLNFSAGKTSGYLTDPYKIISQVDSITGITQDYITEKRQDHRYRAAVYWKTVVHLPEDVIHFSYRYYRDSWAVKSHTLKADYQFNITNHLYIIPSARLYTQTRAKFFHYSLLKNEPIPAYASADLRLAPMISATAGLKIGYNFGPNSEISARIQHMRQYGEKHQAEAVGLQKQLDLFPTLQVWMFNIELTMDI